MKVQAPSFAPGLRSDTQGRILARLLADPATSCTLSTSKDDADEGIADALPGGRLAAHVPGVPS